MSTSDFINYVKDKKILILGFGREGRSTYGFIRRHLPDKPLTIGDLNEVRVDDPLVSYDCGEGYLSHLDRYGLVFKSPGIPFIDVSWPDTTEITCQTDMFLHFCECPVVGITGTKGKTTTSTLTHSILTHAGLKASLIGNMGVPVLDYLDMGRDEIAVIEMSSHQLEFTRTSPHVAILTNIYEEHLDHYEGGMTGYVSAKLNIVRHQKPGDVFIYNATQGLDGWFDPDSVPSKKISVPLGNSGLDVPQSAWLPGDHNRQDVEYAFSAAKQFGADEAAMRAAVADFRGIEHRLERFGEFGGVVWYDDAIATAPFATICGVRAVTGEVCPVGTLIIGGLDREISYDSFEDWIASSDIDNIICMPETGHKIADALSGRQVKPRLIKARDMAEAVDAAVRYTAPGKACILSPSAASYNVYKNFEEKGREFKRMVKERFGGK